MSVFLHNLKTSNAKVASVALALMMRQGVALIDQLDYDQLSDSVKSLLDGRDDMLSVLRAPVKIEGYRTPSACVTIVSCRSCKRWYTVKLRKLVKQGGVYGLPLAEINKLKCDLTTDCTGTVEVALPAIIEGPTK